MQFYVGVHGPWGYKLASETGKSGSNKKAAESMIFDLVVYIIIFLLEIIYKFEILMKDSL
jgi:hypothetical protein